MFPSSRNVSKLSEFAEKGNGDAAAGDEQDAPRSRFFGDKSNRKSLNEKEGRDNRESWTSARERRQLGGDDEHKTEGRYNRRDRDQDGERRNGHGDRPEGGWGARDSRRQNGERQGGWRDRERDKKDRDWDRGGHAEKEPEWMDDPPPAGAEDDLRSMGMARNQEEFQKWKAAMSGKKVEEASTTEPAQPSKDATAPKPAAALKLEGIVDKPFGSWGDAKPPGTADTAIPTTKTAQPKSKGSRFASMFKDQVKDEPPPAEPTAPKPEEAAEDEAGFKRILQMLGGTGINQPAAQEGPSSPPPKSTANGTMKQKSRFTGLWDQTPKSPEPVQSPQAANDGDVFQGARGLSDEPGSMFGGRLHETYSNDQPNRGQAPSNPMSPEPMFPQNGNRDQQQYSQPQRMSDIFHEQPPSRDAATPDNNIQNLLASQRSQRPQGQDKDFLLNLLQAKGSRPASQQALPLESNFQLWRDQPPNMPEPHAPKPRLPPSAGLFEDQLLRSTSLDHQRQEPQPMPGNELLQRRTSQRAPPGFYPDEQTMFLQQQQQAAQRRNFTEPPQPQHPRRMSGHPNLPQMQIPQHHQQFPGPPPEFLQSPGGHQQAPPPGFNPHMPRHPPGFHNIPNIFQPPQQQGREPPGYPGGMPGSAGSMQSPPNAPPGFYGTPQGMPPGFMQMRSPTESISAGAGPPRGNGRGFDPAMFEGQMGNLRR